MDRYEFSANYSEDLVRRSVRRHFPEIIRHEFSWRIYVGVAVTGGALVYRLLYGQTSWIDGAAVTVLVLLPLLVLAETGATFGTFSVSVRFAESNLHVQLRTSHE
jgi:hypothetical protein